MKAVYHPSTRFSHLGMKLHPRHEKLRGQVGEKLAFIGIIFLSFLHPLKYGTCFLL
jgi:hypothetical protein